ncbi:hypothetical protein [Bradyrhizobium sp. WSM471]|uniref:hypothetical protein n=1 Tax=Bradyrhizobium sp. WSM471 TaxID=319017 RepID=UPI0018DEEC0A|nr:MULTISPECIES: hypothetical protein [Bradyrhizobium]UFW43000.1 hypothetical protein BcanWSM471_07730 [Bradyrhizobium canariense]
MRAAADLQHQTIIQAPTNAKNNKSEEVSRALVAGAMQSARLLQHPVGASADEWVAFLCGNPRALVVRHDAVSRSVQFKNKLIAFAKHWGFRPRARATYRART